MPVRVEIASPVLSWAVERSGRPRDQLIRKFPRFDEWAAGSAQPTLKQAEAFARFTYTPFGMLFLSEPPEESLPVPDFRVRGRPQTLSPASPNLLDTIYLCEARQEWYRGYAQRNELDALEFVGSADTSVPVIDAAAEIRSQLAFGLEARQEFTTWTEALRELILRAEDIGVLVMVSGVVGNNTHRALDPDEFGGFALVDELAPLVFVNGADSKAAQIFTLAHELAHVWLGQSAISNSAVEVVDIDLSAEEWCNQVAAELLVPRASLVDRFVPGAVLQDEVERLARFYKVSTLVALRRLLDTDLISWDIYREAYHAELDRIKGLEERSSSGGDFYATQPVRSSRLFTTALVSETLSGRTLYWEAFRLLGIKNPATFKELGERLGVA